MSNARNLARLIVDSGGDLDASAFNNAPTGRNRIINGGMMIDQRNAGAAVTIPAETSTYPVDRFSVFENSSAVLTAQQDSVAPIGFSNSLKITVTTADESITSGEQVFLRQRIEGFSVADLGFGTASASPVTLSFWVRSSVTGTFSGALQNGATDRSYPFTYSISAANTWEQKTITVAGDTTGTWLTTNGIGLQVIWSLGVGTSFQGTAGSWASGALRGATGETQLISTLNATFYITGVQLEEGSVATPFEHRQYGQELALCQRYYCKTYAIATVPGTATDTNAVTFPLQGNCSYARTIWHFPVTMRATPTFVSYNTNNGTAGQVSADASNYTNATLTVGEGRVTNGVSSQTIGVDTYLKWHGTASAEL